MANGFIEPNAPEGGKQVTVYGPNGEVTTAQLFTRPTDPNEKSEYSRFIEDMGYSNTPPAGTSPVSDNDSSAPYSKEQAKVLLPYITKLDPVRGEKLIDAYTQGFIDTGKPEFALASMRNTAEYSEMFEGIKRPDGSLRMTEAQYLQNKEAVAIHLNEYNLGGYGKENLDVIFPKLLANNVNPDEFRSRVDAVQKSITALPEEQKAQVLGQYSEYYSNELGETVVADESTLVAIAIDPDVNSQILSRRLNVSQIGATFERVTGEDVDFNTIQRLISGGITAQKAAGEFETATARAMTASRLARRFNRDEQDYTALQFAEMGASGDTEFADQLGLLGAQVESSSSRQTGARKTQEGEVTCLTEK